MKYYPLDPVRWVGIAASVIRSIVVIVFLTLTVALQAEENNDDRGLLWRIYKQGLPTSYLFATIHSEDQRVLELPAYVSQVIKTVDVVVLEVPVDDQAGNASLRLMLFADNRRLSNVLDTCNVRKSPAGDGRSWVFERGDGSFKAMGGQYYLECSEA